MKIYSISGDLSVVPKRAMRQMKYRVFPAAGRASLELDA
jgi:hypothetical protein